jgi:hypothetical protein
MPKAKLPFNVYDLADVINPDGSLIESEGKPLNQRMKIDASRIKSRPTGPTPQPKQSPWISEYPTGFSNDGVRSQMRSDFTMPAEGAGLPAKYVANPEVIEAAPKASSNLPPRVNTFNGKLIDPNVGRLQDAKGLMAALAMESILPSTVMANETEQGLIDEDKVKNGHGRLQVNPAMEIANTNFSDPLLASLFSQTKPTPSATRIAATPKSTVRMVDQDTSGGELVDNDEDSFQQWQAGKIPADTPTETNVTPDSVNGSIRLSGNLPQQQNNPQFVNGDGLTNMIQDYSGKGQSMNEGRDAELLRLMNMRDNAETVMGERTAFNGMDLSALNAFVDSTTGSNLSRGYKAPSSGVDNLNMLNTLNDRVTNHTKSKNAEQLALYKTLLDSQYKDELLDLKAKLGANKPSPFAVMDYKASLQKQTGDFDDAFKVRSAFHKDGGIENLDAGIELTNKLTKFREALGNSKGLAGRMVGAKRANLESLYSQIMTQINRDDAKLGALAGPDLAILKQQFKEPTGLAGFYNDQVNGGIDAQLANIESFIKKIGDRSHYQLSKASKTYGPLGHANDMIDEYNNILSKTYGGGQQANAKGSTSPSYLEQLKILDDKIAEAKKK